MRYKGQVAKGSRGLKHGGVIAATMVLAVVWAGPVAAAEKAIEPPMNPKLRLGKMAYDISCASCHGKAGAGTDKGPPFLHRVYHPGHHGDAAFYRAARQGARAHHWKFGDMKPVAGVTDAQLAKIIGYIRAVQSANGLF